MTNRPDSFGNPVPVAAFVTALRDSRLLSEEQLAPLDQTVAGLPADGRDLGRQLVRDGLLTEYQAAQLLAGRPDGLVLGHYRLLQPLGAGGMGSVFLAEHELLRRRVAVKLLAEHLEPDAAAVARFRWEVQVAAQLCHPNIVAVHDAGEADGRRFLVMEYVDGVDLGRLVRERGPLPVALACECVRQAALGLQHAHAAGFVHCDVKPANFLLTRNTEPGVAHEWTASPYFTPYSEFRMVKVVDLGLARRLGAAANGTHAAPLAGSADYLAPEQARDPHRADGRSDLYGLGCTFYYLLTGRAPFAGGAWPDKLLRHQLDPPTPVRVLRPEVPAEIEAVVTRLMSKDPAGRYAVPAEVAVVLHEWLVGHRDAGGVPAAARGPTAAKTRAALDDVTVPNLSRPISVATGVPPVVLPATGGTPVATGRGAPWGVLTSLAVVLGLATAAVIHYAPWEAPPSAAPARLPAAYATLASRPDEVFVDLPTAVAAAHDGDTIWLHGDGPFSTRPLAPRGKSLTLRAAGAAHACVQLARQPTGTEFFPRPLLSTDRPLRLEGVELGCAEAGARPGAAALHLVYAEGAPVTLVNCRLIGHGDGGLVVARHAPAVVVENSALVGRGPAVVIEVGEAPVTLRVAGSRLECTGAGAPALTVWVPEACRPADVRLDLTGSTVRAGRVVAFSGLPRQVGVTAHGNVFAFREALVSFAGCAGPDAWRATTRWQGRDNRYRGSAEWLAVDGRPGGVRGLDQWRGLWQDGEPGSIEETLLSLSGERQATAGPARSPAAPR